jgi:hypothetical protein
LFTNPFDGVGRGCDGCQDGFVLPIQVCFDAPVETESCHEDHNNDPEDSPDDGLIGEEDVDQAHPLVNFTNILPAAFAAIVLYQKITKAKLCNKRKAGKEHFFTKKLIVK